MNTNRSPVDFFRDDKGIAMCYAFTAFRRIDLY